MAALTLPSLDNTLGAVFIGGICSSILYGITTMQTFAYYRNYRNDTTMLKVVIGTLWLMNTLHIAFVSHGLYYYMVTNFANPLALLRPVWSLLIVIISTCITYMIVSVTYAYRVLKVSGSWLLSIVPVVFCFIGAAFGFFIAGRGLTNEPFTELNALQWALYSTYGAAVACDAWIASVTCFYLHRSRTGLKPTDNLLNTLMLYCVSTGGISCLIHICNLVTYSTMKNNFVYIGVYVITSEVYTNALLATLNSRSYLQRTRRTGPVALSSLSSSAKSHPGPPRHSNFSSVLSNIDADTDTAKGLEVNTSSDSYIVYGSSLDSYARIGSAV